jgi:serine/threonine protein kinase
VRTLHHLHVGKVFHGDWKVDNIMIMRSLLLAAFDFGHSTIKTKFLNNKGHGSAEFNPPEAL